ncbi:hypothetical protein [Symbioplanes lichenis]|uniref:hypothetical protein n=1 Tax=Symbioplanes lichenis TaxID=1629072 RepID=UPI00273A2349|nr:hypothetical protein [Actinoplanes lichenis]
MTAQPTLSTDAPEVAQPEAATVAPARRQWPLHLLAAVLFIGLGLLVMGNYLPDPNQRVSGHLANDNTWFQWLLGHAQYSVTHWTNPLFSVRQNYPVGVNMMANTSVLGVTVPLVPVTMLFGVRVAYLVWMVLALAGSAFSAYFVLRRWVVRSWVAAFLGGAFFGFAPGFVHHANGQPNFASNFALPFIVIMVIRLGVTGRWLRDGIILGLLVTYQVFINEEMLVVTAAALVVTVLVHALLSPRKAWARARSFVLAATVTAVVAGVLLAYPLYWQFMGPRTFEALPIYHSWGEDLGTYLYVARDTIFGDPIVETTMGKPEQNSWFGWPLTLVVAVALLVGVRRHLTVRVAALVLLVFAIMSMGPKIRWMGEYTDLPGPWHWIPDDLPVLGLLTPSRLTFAVVGVFALMTALAYDTVARLRTRPVAWIGAALVCAALVPLIPRPLPAVEDPLPPTFITSGAFGPYVPAGKSLIPLPLPNRYAGRETLGWTAWGEQDFVVPEGYFLGPGDDGHGQHGADASTLTWMVEQTLKGKPPQVTGRRKIEVAAAIQRYRGALLVLRDEPVNAPVKTLVDELVGPSEQVMDVWIWRVG